MACDFCEGTTCLFQSEYKLWMKGGLLHVAGKFSKAEKHEINNCPMCGEDMEKIRKETNDGEVH